MNFSKINIVFICGSLEPGKDGVGDYTRRLAGELVRMGNNVFLLSIYDRFVTDLYEGHIMDTTTRLNCLRIPANYTFNQRVTYSRSFTKKCQPDWISLQYVPFSFHPKGLHIRLKSLLKNLNPGVKWHIMFHELWTGSQGANDLKTKIYGRLQKIIIRNLVRKFNFSVITTSIENYQKAIDFKQSFLLPIFGNIPQLNYKIELKRNSGNLFRVIVFGTITNDLDLFNKQIIWLNSLAHAAHKKMELFFIGNSGSNLTHAKAIAANIIGDELINITGFLSEDVIASHLIAADFGISRADFEYYGKSGTTLSMLEYGLPVLLKGERPLNIKESTVDKYFPQLYFPNDSIGFDFREFKFHNGLFSTTTAFLDLLSVR